MQKIDKEEAEKILLKTNEKPIFQNDPIGVSIDFILSIYNRLLLNIL